MLWAQLLVIAPLVYLGIRLGLRLGKSGCWWVAFLGAMAWVGLVIVGHRFPRYSLQVPVSWAVDIRFGPPVMAFVIPLVFALLVPRLPRGRRTSVSLVAGVMTINFGLLPAATVLLARPVLAGSTTRIDAHGVCLQTHGFSCGPSATVTCLRALGVAGDEGPLSIAACCGPMVGTDSRYLAETINREFGGRGISARCRYVESLVALQTPAVAAMNMRLIGGHFVAVLAVEPDFVTVGDPLSGMVRMSSKDFLACWTHIAIELQGSGGEEGVRPPNQDRQLLPHTLAVFPITDRSSR